MRKKEYIAGYLFILPLFSGLLVFYIFAFFLNIYYSFTDKSSFGKPHFIGLENYIRLFSDEKFYSALVNTLKYVVIAVPSIVVLSLLLAVLLNNKIKLIGLYRTIIFIPAVTMPAAIGLVWRWLFNYEFGLINAVIVHFGGKPVAWLSDPKLSLISVSIVLIWSVVSYQMIVMLAGLQNVSSEYYEAAEIDGASSFQKFLRITLPLMSPTIFFVTVITFINIFQIFDFIYLMIPKSSSGIEGARSLVYYFYDQSFIRYNKGYGSAISIVLFIIILIVTVIQLKLQKKWVHYN